MSNKSEYNSTSEWAKAKPKDYQSAVRQGLITLICEHYGWKYNKPSGYWTKDKCIEEALKYNTSGEWKRGCGSSYQKAASSGGWLIECSKHFNNVNRPAGYWTKERCIEDAKQYKTKKDWECKSSSSHSAARKNGWYDECTKHMTSIIRQSGYWTKERCIKEAKKYTKKSYWKRGCGSSLNAAVKNGWYDECVKHMK